MKTSLAALGWAAALLGLVTCAAPGAPPVASADSATVAVQPSTNAAAVLAPQIREKSCGAETVTPSRFSDIALAVRALSDAQAGAISKRLPEGARFAGGWDLASEDPNFGGLSGLAFAQGNLLAVSDAGAWIGLSVIEGAPTTATIGYMTGADGRLLSGKAENDAEGLVWYDGVAFVSFERDFRIEAFDLAGCGAAARAVRAASLPAEYGDKPVDTNSGPEALALTPDGALLFGYESAPDSVSPIGEVQADGTSRWTGRLSANPKGFALVGMDIVRLPSGEDREISLYRAFDPLRGARSVLVWGPGKDQRLTLSRPMLTDNFEGLAAEVLESGELRLWIVSDSNFNAVQRTLLYAFDVTP
jgi:hypothetical protein